MDEVTVTLTGLDELEEAFTVGSERAMRRFLRNAEMKAAKVLQDTASANAPYAEGNLSEHIRRQSVQSEDGVRVRVGPDREAFYGTFQEFGAPEAGVPALHWLEDSAKECQDEVLEELTAAFQIGLQEMKR